jgi:hypothetical protein
MEVHLTPDVKASLASGKQSGSIETADKVLDSITGRFVAQRLDPCYGTI